MGDCGLCVVRDQGTMSRDPKDLSLSSWDPLGRDPTDLSLLLLHAWLFNDGGLLGHGLNDGRGRFCHLGCGGHNVWNLDGTLLELVGELFVQEIADDQYGDDRYDVEHVKGRLGGDLLDDGALGVVDDWGTHY